MREVMCHFPLGKQRTCSRIAPCYAGVLHSGLSEGHEVNKDMRAERDCYMFGLSVYCSERGLIKESDVPLTGREWMSGSEIWPLMATTFWS